MFRVSIVRTVLQTKYLNLRVNKTHDNGFTVYTMVDYIQGVHIIMASQSIL